MMKQLWIIGLVALALVAPTASAQTAAPYNFETDLASVAAFPLADLSFFAPATADVNNNSILDKYEFALITHALSGSFSFTSALSTVVTANINAAATDLGAGGNGLLPAMKNVLGAYATLGNDDSWAVVQLILENSGDFGGNTTPSRSNYNETQGVKVGPCGDADNDGVANNREFFALATPSAANYAAAAFSAATNTDGGDLGGGCGTFVFTQKHLYNPATGNVYYINNLMEPTWTAAKAFADTYTIGTALIEGAHLVTINNEAENTWLKEKITGDVWLSANDQATEGDWKWHDGTSFWSGAAAGTAVNGAYTNWRPGEPNNAGTAGEDFAEMKGPSTSTPAQLGGWNDSSPTSTNGVAIEIEGPFSDANSDGIPDGWVDANEDGTPDSVGVGVVVVTVAGGAPAQIFVTATLQLQSASEEPTDTFAYVSLHPSIATVSASGLVTGVAAGTARIRSTGSVSGATGTIDITVTVPAWYDICTYDNAFTSQLGLLAGLGLDEVDAENDGVPDAWQLQLLAYALCTGNADALAAYNANIAAMNPVKAALPAYTAFINNLLGQISAISNLSTSFVGHPCDGAGAALGIPSLAAVLASVTTPSVVSSLQTLSFGTGLVTAGALDVGFAGLATTSTEMANYLLAELFEDPVTGDPGALFPEELGDLLFLLQVIAAPQAAGGLPDACNGVGSVKTQAAAILGALGTTSVPAVPAPVWVALQDAAKLPDEPLAGAGDYDGDGLTNAEVAAIVTAQGGGANDFVVAASGDFGPFWPGNPGLPVGTMVVGVLVGAFAAGGAVAIRRRRK